ncbi:MAG TPA: P-loop NTPase fold protein [Nitrososphaeraceae archaeon]|nr:P-loop NTPase fold protein [Nitrososphaeraceae archaeon]
MTEKTYKEKVLEQLAYQKDDPNIESNFFHFTDFASQLKKFVLDPKTPTPYTIGLHGEWGAGKTSLLKRVYQQVCKEINEKLSNKNWKTIWFNAWEYEMLDPALALMQKIELSYEKNRDTRSKQIVTGSLLTFSDVLLRTYAHVGVKDIKENYKRTVDHLSKISDKLRKTIGDNGRLIVFIDDLDRCLIDNVLKMLETIKQLLSVEGIIFVMAVDMSKLERAWELRYKGSVTAIREGRDHVEKIFQLKLSLPPKTLQEIEIYVNNMTNALENKIRLFITEGCPPNPRKIKRIINEVLFISSSYDESKYEKDLPLIIIWIIITTMYPELSLHIRQCPDSLIQMSMITHHMQDVDALESRLVQFRRVISSGDVVSISKNSNLPINHEKLFLQTVKGLEYIVNNPYAFKFLKMVAQHYSIIVNNEVPDNVISTLEKHYAGLGKDIGMIANQARLLA